MREVPKYSIEDHDHPTFIISENMIKFPIRLVRQVNNESPPLLKICYSHIRYLSIQRSYDDFGFRHLDKSRDKYAKTLYFFVVYVLRKLDEVDFVLNPFWLSIVAIGEKVRTAMNANELIAKLLMKLLHKVFMIRLPILDKIAGDPFLFATIVIVIGNECRKSLLIFSPIDGV